MSYKVAPAQEVIDYFIAVGFDYKINTDSIYTDKRDAPVHYFQSKGADGFKLVSTILADDATLIFNSLTEPVSSKIAKAFGDRCKNGHLRSNQPCKECKGIDKRLKQNGDKNRE